ncbi:MAG: DUF4390 domain-containing protein [Acidobacteriota bacterium]
MMALRLLAFVLALPAVIPAGDTGLQVATLVRDSHVLVSWTFADGALDQLNEAIDSGLTTSFTYDVDLRRSVSVWFDRTISTATVAVSVRKDTLTGRYQLTRSIDGRVEDSRVSDSGETVRTFMTAVDRLPLFPTSELQANVEYTIRVRVRTRPRVTWFFWPWDRNAATGSARFTFIA